MSWQEGGCECCSIMEEVDLYDKRGLQDNKLQQWMPSTIQPSYISIKSTQKAYVQHYEASTDMLRNDFHSYISIKSYVGEEKIFSQHASILVVFLHKVLRQIRVLTQEMQRALDYAAK